MQSYRVWDGSKMSKTMSKHKMPRNLKLSMMGLAIAVATLLALPIATNQAHAAAPPEKRDFFGTLDSVDVDIIHVSLADEFIVDVRVTPDTTIRLPLKEDAQLTDLFEGDTVAVSMTDDLSSASKIFVIPGKTQFRHVPGDIEAVNDDSITLQPLATGSEAIEFNIGPDTEIKFRAGATEMVEGVFAVVLTRRNPLTGEMSPEALEIHVTAGKSRPKHVEASPQEPAKKQQTKNEVKVVGLFESLDDDGNWIISRRTVTTDADTEIDSGVVAGQRVKVEGVLLDDGTILAREIERIEDSGNNPNRARFEGIFEGLDEDGNWNVSGKVIIITDDTDTDGKPFIGQRVTINGFSKDLRTFIAREIENIVEPSLDDTSPGRPKSVKLEGIYEGVDKSGDWIVNGMAVGVDRLTKLEGTPEIGSTVEIKGVLRDDKIIALKIEFEDSDAEFGGASLNRVRLSGLIEAMSDDGSVIFIDSHRVHISDLTEIDGDIALGVMVRVLAFITEDGTLAAKEVDVRKEDTDGEEQEDEGDDSIRIDGDIEITNDDGSFIVNGITIIVPALLSADRVFTEGLKVRVYGVFQDDGSLLASRIRGGEADEEKDDDEQRIRGIIEEVIVDGNKVVAIVVDGQTIRIQALTEIDSPLRPGVPVVVEVITTDRGLVAKEIDQARRGRRASDKTDEVDSDELKELEGIVLSFSDQRVTLGEGRSIATNSDTRIDGDLYIGAEVKIRLYVNDSDIMVATRIKVSKPDDNSDSTLLTDIKTTNEANNEVDEPEVEDRNKEFKIEGFVRVFSSTRLIRRLRGKGRGYPKS
jgi:Cu/Ag efflux protein CusF